MKRYRDWSPSAFDTRGLALGERQDWFVLPVGTNRDADALTRSNWRVVVADLGGESDDLEIHRFGHWACGWFEIAIVRPDTEAAKSAEEWEAALSDYPVASDDDFSNEEQEEAQIVWRDCFDDRERLDYIKAHWSQFEHCKAKWYPADEAWRNLLACVRGEVFYGYASEFLS